MKHAVAVKLHVALREAIVGPEEKEREEEGREKIGSIN